MMKRFKQIFLYVALLVVLFGFVGAYSEAEDIKKQGPGARSLPEPATSVTIYCPSKFLLHTIPMGGVTTVWVDEFTELPPNGGFTSNEPGKQVLNCVYSAVSAHVRTFVPPGSCEEISQGPNSAKFKCKPGTIGHQ
jgi:hypothetical protein